VIKPSLTEFPAVTLGGRPRTRHPFEEAMAEYESRRNALAMPIYEFACQSSALFELPSPELRMLLDALRENPI
jgi:hypothetical protein